MQTRIGTGWKGKQALWAVLIGLGAVAFDLAQQGSTGYTLQRLGLGLAVVMFLATLSKDGPDSVGLTWRARPSWKFWPKRICLLGVIVLACSLVVCAVLWWKDALPAMESTFTDKSAMLRNLWLSCLWAPIEEEMLYRVALCAPLAAWLGPRVTILIGGLVFAGLHHLYGNLGPNHLFAGLVMTWAYLRSGTILLPLLLHSLGNLAVWLMQVVLFYRG
ncbi:MAG: type II CAAX endopeptidase family protein [Planctomycetota bacterium]|nr:type II CAAX endopeptidase family protein [Planctomycetota bacterium]